MGLRAWIRSKLLLGKSNDEGIFIQALRKENEKLKEENEILREKVIVSSQRNNESIPIKFYDENIEQVIIENIRETKKELSIAMAWFTSQNLMNELNSLKKRGVNIKVIISDAKTNNKNKYKLQNACNALKIAVMPKRSSKNNNYNKNDNLMHNKYCIIDGKKVIDGSYNWSNNAKYNLEHIIIIESTTAAKMYKDSFDKIYNNPKYYNDYNVYDMLG